MFLEILESLENAQCLIHASTDRKIIDQRMADYTFWIDQEKSAEKNIIVIYFNQKKPIGKAGFRIEHTKFGGNFL